MPRKKNHLALYLCTRVSRHRFNNNKATETSHPRRNQFNRNKLKRSSSQVTNHMMVVASSSRRRRKVVTKPSVFLLMMCLLASSTSEAFAPIPQYLKNPRQLTGCTPGELPMAKRATSAKPNSKKLNKRNNKSSSPPPPKRLDLSTISPRPVLFHYDANRNDQVNNQRLSDAINCEHFGTCPGCAVNDHVGGVDIIQSAQQYFSSTLVRKARPDVIASNENWVAEGTNDGFYKVVVPSAVTEWRTQAKLAVAPKSSSWAKDGCSFGLYQRGSHQVLTIPDCQVHHPNINKAVNALTEATKRVSTPAFSRDSNDNVGLRYVQLQVERSTGKVSLTLVWAASQLKYTQPALSRLTKELQKLEPDLWHSMWCHINDGPGNNIFSRNAKNWHRLSGPEFVREPFAVSDMGWLYFSPLAFRQGNIDGFDVLATDVAKAIPGGSKVCELYAGVGVLGLTALLHHAFDDNPLTWVRCSDENPVNPRCFTRTISSLPIEVTEHQRKSSNSREGMTIAEIAKMMEAGEMLDKPERQGKRTSYMVATAGDALRAGQALGADVLVVDPPRKGLDPDVLEELCKPVNPNQPMVESPNLLTMEDERVNWTNDVTRLVYVSCGFDALARDCDALLSNAGGWQLMSATGYVLFPGTDHVETICVFERN